MNAAQELKLGSVAEALLQVCMHSHGHRAQVATRLRQHGAVPPPTGLHQLAHEPTRGGLAFVRHATGA